MKLIGLCDSPYVRCVAVTMRLYGFEFEPAYCENLPAFVDTPLE